MYIFACVRLRCVECRAGTSIFGCFAGLGAGPVLIFFVLLALFWRVFVWLNRWGGVAGQYDFSGILCFLLAGRYD